MANAPQTKPASTASAASATKPIPKGVTVEVAPGARLPEHSIMDAVKNAEAVPVDNVNSPSHYTGKRTELIDITADLPFWKANAMKYILRMGDKVGVDPFEDLAKARKYLDFGERLLKGEPISDTLRDQIHDWENPGIPEAPAKGDANA